MDISLETLEDSSTQLILGLSFLTMIAPHRVERDRGRLGANILSLYYIHIDRLLGVSWREGGGGAITSTMATIMHASHCYYLYRHSHPIPDNLIKEQREQLWIKLWLHFVLDSRQDTGHNDGSHRKDAEPRVSCLATTGGSQIQSK